MDFLSRISGTILDGDLEASFNLYLVLTKRRQAFLIEPHNYSTQKEGQRVVDQIRELFPELVYQPVGNSVLITLEPVHVPGSEEDLATVLGFDQHGLPNPNNPRTVLHHYINGTNFMAEVAEQLSGDRISQLKEKWENQFGPAADELGWAYQIEFQDIIPNNMIYQMVFDRKITPENYQLIVDRISGEGYEVILDELTYEGIMDRYQDVLFAFILFEVVQFYNHNYPLDDEENKFFDIILTKLMNNNDPTGNVDQVMDMIDPEAQEKLQEAVRIYQEFQKKEIKGGGGECVDICSIM